MTEKTTREIVYGEWLRDMEGILSGLRMRVQDELELENVDRAIDYVRAAAERMEIAATHAQRLEMLELRK